MRKTVLLFTLSLMMFHIYSCDEDPVTPKAGQLPSIVTLHIPTIWGINAVEPLLIEIKTDDPQGVQTLSSATFTLYDDANNQVFNGTLKDDGAYDISGDIIARDGIFRNRFLPSDLSKTEGTYYFIFTIIDSDDNMIKSEKQAVQFEFNSPPVIKNVSYPTLFTSGAEGVFQVGFSDPDGVDNLKHTSMDLIKNGASVLATPVIMFNDGNTAKNGDLLAADSVFSVKQDSSFGAARVGDYVLRFSAEDLSGNKSKTVDKIITIENGTGKIKAAKLPATIMRPTQTGVFEKTLITVDISDPQGLGDIDSVYFNFYKPNGTPAKNNPFIMVDNGKPFNINNLFEEAGDKTANDGTYSLTFLVDSNNEKGDYTFKFYMRDKAGNAATVLEQSLEVK